MSAPNRKKLLVPDTMSRAGWAVAAGRDDIDMVAYSPDVTPEEFHRLLASAQGVALSTTRFGAAELAAAPLLRVVGRIGVGYDQVDVPALSGRGVPLMVAGVANSPSVAEAAVYMMLALAKRGAALDRLVKHGFWRSRFEVAPFDLLGKTVLIIGFGRIGTRTAARLAGFEMRITVHDPFVPAEQITAVGAIPAPDLDAGLREADFITIHCPKTPATVGMFDARRLALLKPGAYLVNTARGGIVDEPALHAALVAGRLAGAGLDVFAVEPTPADNPLLRLENVVTAPHMAGVTHESMDRMAVTTVRNMLSVLDGSPARENAVNAEAVA
jgi:D-3-phosphoglycerate dehydrogenase